MTGKRAVIEYHKTRGVMIATTVLGKSYAQRRQHEQRKRHKKNRG